MLFPRVSFDPMVIENLSLPWKDALVVKLLSNLLGYTAVMQRLRSLWRLQAVYDFVDMRTEYFMSKFDFPYDYEKVIGRRPWILHDHYLAVKQWWRPSKYLLLRRIGV